MNHQPSTVFDETYRWLISAIESNGWYIVLVIAVMYTFQIPQKLSRVPGLVDDFFNKSKRKSILDEDLRRVRRKQANSSGVAK